MCGCFVVNIVPGDDVVPSAGGGVAHSEDEFLTEGPRQQLQDPIAL